MTGRKERAEAQAAAYAVVDAELARFQRDQAERGAADTVTALRAHFEAERAALLADNPQVDAAELTRRLVGRLMHRPTTALRQEQPDKSLDEAARRLYDGKPMEVGPLARIIIAKNPDVLGLVQKGALPGAVARHAARAIETKLVVDARYTWLDQLLAAMTKPGFKIHDTEHWQPPFSGMGAGFSEPPRGALGHWIKVKDQKIENYQAVVPSTWNASPRCNNGVRGQYEESLIGTPVPDPNNPINVVRIIRSFDPCLACAVHIIDPQTNEIRKFFVE